MEIKVQDTSVIYRPKFWNTKNILLGLIRFFDPDLGSLFYSSEF